MERVFVGEKTIKPVRRKVRECKGVERGTGMTDGYRFGWESLAEYAGCSRRSMCMKKNELEKAGVIDFPLKGRPPKRVMRWKPDLFDTYRAKNK